MKLFSPYATCHVFVWSAILLAGVTGCAGVRTGEEQSARDSLAKIEPSFRPQGKRPELPLLNESSSPSDYLRFALLNHPQVEAAFLEWRSDVLAIESARALPDPQLTFQADIARSVMALMPGLMFDVMAPGKRAAMGREASAAATVAYRNYAAALVTTASGVRRAWIELTSIDASLRILHEQADTLSQALATVQNDYATGRAMGTLEEQTRFLSSLEKAKNDADVLTERKFAAQAQFKAALGLHRDEPDPSWPAAPWPSPSLPSEEELWRQALAANLSLGSMRAMVEMAVAKAELARTANQPDFSAGLMADVKADPLMYRPTATMSLPVWRSKIAAAVDSAEAKRLAAEAGLSAEQTNMAAELARMLFMARESERMLAFIDRAGLPNLARAIRSAEASYATGLGRLADLAELHLMEEQMRLERVDTQREHDLALADLAAFVAADVPPGLVLAGDKTFKTK